MMRQITLSINQIRHWRNAPANWMVNGYSSTQDVLHMNDSTQFAQLLPGGWSTSAVTYLRIEWEGAPDRECMYMIRIDDRRAYYGLWTPKLLETITESFFFDGDLLAINYRLLRSVDA